MGRKSTPIMSLKLWFYHIRTTHSSAFNPQGSLLWKLNSTLRPLTSPLLPSCRRTALHNREDNSICRIPITYFSRSNQHHTQRSILGSVQDSTHRLAARIGIIFLFHFSSQIHQPNLQLNDQCFQLIRKECDA